MRTQITPEKAKEMLTNNTINRAPSERRIRALAQQIKDGYWLYNGQPIILSNTGILLDGQHRLLACIMANKPIDSYIVRGVENTAFNTMDTGKPRTASDILSIRKVKNYTVTASCLRALRNYSKMENLTSPINHKSMGLKLDNASVGNVYDALNSHIENNYAFNRLGINSAEELIELLVAYTKNVPNMRNGVYIAACLIIILINPEKGLSFSKRVSDGLFSSQSDPCKKIHEFISNGSKTNKDFVKGSAYQNYKISMLFKSWNAYCDEKEIKLLRFNGFFSNPFNNKECYTLINPLEIYSNL